MKTKTSIYKIIIIIIIFIQSNSFVIGAELLEVASLYTGDIYLSSKYPDAKLPYRIYVPNDYSEKNYPLVLQLNGAGENGNDNEKQINYPNVLTHLLLEGDNPQEYPCIILAPQCPVDDRWVTNFYGDISKTMDITIELVNEICNKYNADKSRLYVTGYSSGGSGVWDLLYRYPNMFAAAIPIAGNTAPAYAEVIKNVSLWVFHIDGDPTVSVEQSRNMVKALEEVGNTSVKYTEGNSSDRKMAHRLAWATAYKEPELLPWLFLQKNQNLSVAYNLTNKSFNIVYKSKQKLIVVVCILLISLIAISSVGLKVYRKYIFKKIIKNK